ncbi:hypothetical protein E1176_12985 [Fulvivirga sp. RKSG066]|uniref:hypothetical protein n=1 Tax=Fulvivirga aurantia TaxID=2529383 RepID=UPI0012BD2629|nr:hypothetical protein [Fulvivirga aurantia]MTI21940.1 hypothetical protein [Fulvivirga aurantia]
MSNLHKTREELEASAEEYEHALEQDVDELLSKTKTILTGTLVVGAGFWVAYKLFKALASDNHQETSRASVVPQATSDDEPSVFSVVKHTIMKELAFFLLGIIKEKLLDYLQAIKGDDNNS